MSDGIEVTATVRFRPWTVPNYATVEMPPRPRQDGFRQGPTYSLKELSQEALDELAAAWLTELYAKAEKPTPFTRAA